MKVSNSVTSAPPSFSSPLYHRASLVPLFYIGATVLAGTIMALGEPSQVIGTVLTFGVGAVAYLVTRARCRRDSVDRLS